MCTRTKGGLSSDLVTDHTHTNYELLPVIGEAEVSFGGEEVGPGAASEQEDKIMSSASKTQTIVCVEFSS